MDLSSITDAFDRVLKKQKVSYSKSQDMINQIGQEIEQALSRTHSPNTDQKTILNELKNILTEISPLNHLESTQKELNLALTKYPKLLEKSFNPDISKAYRNIDFDPQTLNGIIASHLYRTGQFAAADCFTSECNQPEASQQKGPYQELFHILESLRARNLDPALIWATQNHDHLERIGSDIELKLHRLRFVEILQGSSSNREEALSYARTFFAPIFSKHTAEVQKLMACLLWAGKLESSPYAELLSSAHYESLPAELGQQFLSLMGQPFESPLSVVVEAGVQGLPTLLKLMNVMTAKRQEWQSMKQLPVPIDLDRDFQFHSVFVCPVSREQASEENPPMLLPCGHVLCKQSITKLSKNNATRPFKCPYCPREVEAGQCRQLFL